MRLIELNPKWEEMNGYRYLVFDCPKCGSKDPCLSIPVPPHPKAWKLTGEDFATLTVTPSIDFKHGFWEAEDPAETKCHAHFFITNGEIVNA